ncbi:DUF2147 domain-containing protein [Bradyrhizobium jicamae]|uniref:DUF2147 domain-containing protein n=1 Tax=Bradyrhizobium jicamae TaxID=280332 RepID=UPI001BAA05FB|nr:DUF2147 domain-containing protein [Bradyrhizobium jicamae]MBR0932486.1 DUF2147 domain-containing protein [Bradyrhizobium jicamae]
MNFLVRLILRGIVAVILMSTISRAEAASPVDPSGTWMTEDGRARIRLERCGAAQQHICGYIVWMKDPLDERGQPMRDSSNPDASKRARSVLGHQLIMGLKPTPEGWFDGDIYNAEDGRSYSVMLWRDSPDRLKLRGCMLKLLCQTQTWKQTNDVLPGQLVGLTGDPGGPRADKEWAKLPVAKTATAGAR